MTNEKEWIRWLEGDSVQNMNWFQIWKHNMKQHREDTKLIKCKDCGYVQRSANWHYFKCNKCNSYLWDDRCWY